MDNIRGDLIKVMPFVTSANALILWKEIHERNHSYQSHPNHQPRQSTILAGHWFN